MEMTKKEYINKLKKELDTIELRYQHLLNENAMIGEDFRSRAMANLLLTSKLEQTIEELQMTIKQNEAVFDHKDMELVVLERVKENSQMESEEYQTRYFDARTQCDSLQLRLEKQTSLVTEYTEEILKIKEDFAQSERRRVENKVDFGCQYNNTTPTNRSARGGHGGGERGGLGSSKGSAGNVSQAGSGRGGAGRGSSTSRRVGGGA